MLGGGLWHGFRSVVAMILGHQDLTLREATTLQVSYVAIALIYAPKDERPTHACANAFHEKAGGSHTRGGTESSDSLVLAFGTRALLELFGFIVQHTGEQKFS